MLGLLSGLDRLLGSLLGGQLSPQSASLLPADVKGLVHLETQEEKNVSRSLLTITTMHTQPPNIRLASSRHKLDSTCPPPPSSFLGMQGNQELPQKLRQYKLLGGVQVTLWEGKELLATSTGW